MNPSDIRAPLTTSELGELDRYLRSDATGEDAMDVEMLDGFLTAIVSGPETIMRDEWLPLVLDTPAVSERGAVGRIVALIMRHLNEIVHRLMYAPEEFDPLLYAGDDDETSSADGMSWCEGYLTAMRLRRERWDDLVDDAQGFRLMAPILALALPDEPDLGKLAETTATHLAALPGAVLGIHHFWVERGTGARA